MAFDWFSEIAISVGLGSIGDETECFAAMMAAWFSLNTIFQLPCTCARRDVLPPPLDPPPQPTESNETPRIRTGIFMQMKVRADVHLVRDGNHIVTHG